LSPVVSTTAFSSAGDVFSLVRSLLMDADIPATSLIATAVRAGNIVTITTKTNHGLMVGNIVQIGYVSDSSFNGTQIITTVPTATTFTYGQALADAISANGTSELLIQGDVWSDTVLIPLANKAYRKVQRRLAEAGSKTTTDEVIIDMPIGQIALTDSSSPQLPPDFLAPRQVWERIHGTQFFSDMIQTDVLPSYSQTGANRWWSWFNESINFIGSTNAMDVRLRYFLGLPSISDATSDILIRGGIDAMASQTAYLAAMARGSSSAPAFAGAFEQDMKELLNLQAHARQYVPGRRRPNNARRGRFGCR